MTRKNGYVADITYPPFFYKEMQPGWLSMQVRLLGLEPPDIAKPFSVCELGCGMAINLLVAAASQPHGHFVGVDFNEQHLAIARDAATYMGLKNIELIHCDFSDFGKTRQQPFDFISSHGVWSWISPQHQQNILDILAQYLKPRGVFYLHYMCHPGATYLLPLQKLLNNVAHHLPGSSTTQVHRGMTLLQQLAAAGAFVDQPLMAAHVQALARKHPHYLAHEFLTDHWQPQHSSDVHRLVADTGAQYVGSANAFDNVEELSIPGDIQPLLAELTHSPTRETVKDLARNQRQRTDLFQREPRAPDSARRWAQMDDVLLTLLPGAPLAGRLNFKTPIGDIPGPAELFSPLLQRLKKGPASFTALAALPPFANNRDLLIQVLQMLMWNTSIHPLLPQSVNVPAAPLMKLNEWIKRNALTIQLVAECGTAINLSEPAG